MDLLVVRFVILRQKDLERKIFNSAVVLFRRLKLTRTPRRLVPAESLAAYKKHGGVSLRLSSQQAGCSYLLSAVFFSMFSDPGFSDKISGFLISGLFFSQNLSVFRCHLKQIVISRNFSKQWDEIDFRKKPRKFIDRLKN